MKWTKFDPTESKTLNQLPKNDTADYVHETNPKAKLCKGDSRQVGKYNEIHMYIFSETLY